MADEEAAIAGALDNPIGCPASRGNGPRQKERRNLRLRHHPARAQPPHPAPRPEAPGRSGHPEERITILIATGLHRAATEGEIVEILGEEIAARVSNRQSQRA